MRKRLALLLVGAVGAASPAAAQAPALRLTLEDAQARAVEASHRLAEARARAGAAAAQADARAVADRPLLGVSAGYTRTNHVDEFIVPGPTGVPRVLYPDVPNNVRSRLDLQWPIYTAGRLDALERAARAEASAAAAEVDAARADLRLEVARAFWAVVTADASIAVLQRGVERARTHLAEARGRTEAGLVPPNEVASAGAQESRARLLLIEAETQRDVSHAALARLIGADIGQGIEPVAVFDATPGETAVLGEADLHVRLAPSPPQEPPLGRGVVTSADIAPLVEEARAAREERRAIELRITAAAEQQAAALAGRKPTVAIAGGVDYARPNPRIFPRADQWNESWDVGLAVNWTFWDGGRSAADAAVAANLETAARQRLAEFDSLLALEIRQRALEVSSGRAAVAAAADAIRAAAEARRVVDERYRAGVTTQAEVLDAEVALLQAELDRTRALANLRLAEARLARAAGR